MKIRMMGTMALGCAALLGPFLAGAQTGMSGSTGSMGGMKMGSDQDKQFLTQAGLSDYTEITFSQLALQKSTDPQVKAYAQKMVTDHQMLETKMKPFADQMGVAPATALDSDHQQKYDALNQLSGADFDKQYMSAMDTDHHKSLDAFKTEETSTQDKQLKPTVKQGEKVVAQHTAMADKMMKKMGGGTGAASGM